MEQIKDTVGIDTDGTVGRGRVRPVANRVDQVSYGWGRHGVVFLPLIDILHGGIS